MTYAVNTAAAPTEGFTGLNMGYDRNAFSASPVLAESCYIERLPSGGYLVSCVDNPIGALFNTPDWYQLVDLSVISGVSASTFKATCFYGVVRESSDQASVYPCRYNYSNSHKVEINATYSQLSGNYVSFQIVLIPQ